MSVEHVVQPGHLGNLTIEQEGVLERLREHMKQELGLTNPIFDDFYLLRFCRARKFVYEDVKLMFDRHIEWRNQNNVDNMANFNLNGMEKLFEYLPHNYYCVDKQGRSVYIEQYKDFDLQAIHKYITKEQLVQYYIYSYERTLHTLNPYLSDRAGRRIEQSITILDLKGLGFMKIMSKREEIQDMLKITSKIAQDNYPEVMGRLFVINSPSIVNVLWSVVKSFLAEDTVKKISILGSDYKNELLKLISPEQLPVFLGGLNRKPLLEGEFEELFQKVVLYRTFHVKQHEEAVEKIQQAEDQNCFNGQSCNIFKALHEGSQKFFSELMGQSFHDDEDVQCLMRLSDSQLSPKKESFNHLATDIPQKENGRVFLQYPKPIQVASPDSLVNSVICSKRSIAYEAHTYQADPWFNQP